MHLSPLADTAADHLEYGTFPGGGPVGLQVIVPSAAYMLALKLKAMRTLDAAMQILARYFPVSAQDTAKQRFLLKHLSRARRRNLSMRPRTLAEACRRAQAGEPFELAIGDVLQTYYLAPDIAARVPMLDDEPPRFADQRYDALVGGIAEYFYKRWAPFRPPPWIKDRGRYLDHPWWPIGEGDPALMEYLTWSSPPEFASRNVMTDEIALSCGSCSGRPRD